jgi:hypothetical protein
MGSIRSAVPEKSSGNSHPIYEMRPWACRVYHCDGDGKDQLIELAIRPREGRSQ